MRHFLPRTFFAQLVLCTLAVQTLLLAAFIYYTVISGSHAAQARTEQRMELQLDRLARATGTELGRNDRRSVQMLLNLSRIAPTIDAARLTDLQGNTLALSQGAPDGLDRVERAALVRGSIRRQVFRIANGQLEAVTPVLVNGKPVALLWLEPNRSISLSTVRALVRVSLTYGIFALLANIVPIFLVTRTMTLPLSRLREATRHVSQQDAGGGFPLAVTTSNEAGELTHSFNTMVRELDQQRNGLLETLALLDSMLENAPIGFAFYDADLRCVRLNYFLAQTYGLDLNEVRGRPDTCTFPASIAEEATRHLKRVFEQGKAIRDVELSGELAGMPGARHSWLMHFYPVRTGEEAVRWAGVIVVEITERHQAEETLRKTEKLAAAGRLAASIAHEINNPLEAVTNLLYLLGTHERLDAGARELVAMAQAELARVSEITQQTLRFYRQSTFPSSTRLTEIFSSLMTLYHSRLVSARVEVVRRFRGDPEVFGFAGELRQLFANLIGNAIDAMPEGGCLTLSMRRGRSRREDGSLAAGVLVWVTDTGTGMSKATQGRIFEAFFTTKQVTGTGLGLWVTQEILRKHGATVRVRSRQESPSGTSFMLFFPDGGLQTQEGHQDQMAAARPSL